MARKCVKFGRSNGKRVCRKFSGTSKRKSSSSKKRTSKKSCIVQSGKKKGKLKKGYRFDKRGNCVKAKSKR